MHKEEQTKAELGNLKTNGDFSGPIGSLQGEKGLDKELSVKIAVHAGA
jgi:hypothetical protein